MTVAVDSDITERVGRMLEASKLLRAYCRDVAGRQAGVVAAWEWVMRRPAVAEVFLEHEVDGLHGLSSASLPSVLEGGRGLVPTSLHRELEIFAVGFEHHSQPYQRRGVHAVSWLFASTTITYAEDRVRGSKVDNPYAYVTYDNAAAIAAMEPPSCHEGLKAEATELQRRLRSGELTGLELDLLQKAFPVVAGICTEAIHPSRLRGEGSSGILGDVVIDGRVTGQHLPALFVPSAEFGRAQALLDAKGVKNTALLSLEDLRNNLPAVA